MEPKQRAIVLKQLNTLPELDNQYPIPSLPSNGLLIEVHYAQIIPADLFLFKGQYGRRPPQPPFIAGAEGSGVVVKVGNSDLNPLIGRKVGFVSDPEDAMFSGAWCEYTVKKLKDILVFEDTADLKQIASSRTNPLTALGMISTLKAKKCKCIVQDVALSALGKIFFRLCQKEGIDVINIVRKQEQLKQLEEAGSEYNICSDRPDFRKELFKICYKLKPTVGFCSAGGDNLSVIASSLAENGTVYNLGNMSGSLMGGLSSGDLIFRNIAIKGWWLMFWAVDNKEEYKKAIKTIVEAYNKGDSIFYSDYSEEVGFSQFNQGIKRYFENMSKGKMLISPKF